MAKFSKASMQECIDLGHAFRGNEDIKIYKQKPSWGKRRSLYCPGCGSWRHELVNIYGEIDLSTRHYDYTDEYKAMEKNKRAVRAERLYKSKAASPSAIKARQAKQKLIDGR